jgi:two-component system, sporulation sensor kinase D
MNIYRQKRRWKLLLFFAAIIIITVSLWYTNTLVLKIASEERQKVRLWADAIQKKASLVNYTENLFDKLKVDERKKVEQWAKANKKIMDASYNEDITFYAEIISNNTTIPVILTDETDKITAANNVDFNKDTVKYLRGKLKEEFTVYDPIVYRYYGKAKVYLYYKDSKIFSELKSVLNDLIKSFISEVVINSASVPVIITDSNKTEIIAFGNIDSSKVKEKLYLKRTLWEMKFQNEPIQVQLANYGKSYVFYKNSYLLTQLRYYPYIQFAIIGIFLVIAYILFSTARNSEQNRVWTGMAKETAHQLGTPLSSLLAWIEIIRSKNVDTKTINEMSKDIERLEKITERFSKIGSPPKLQEENIVKAVYESINYLKSRTSKKVCYNINIPENHNIIVPLNSHLFGWVIENLCKNAVDAMDGNGNIIIDISEEGKHVYIDVSDTGKGIPKSKFKAIFNPGFTSKQRGWGLGLSLAKKIIENYHRGKIFVKSSVINKGTTFRITLKK